MLEGREILTREEQEVIVNDLRHEPFKVLDDGHVMLVDVMGSDSAICEAARVSYGAGITNRSNDVNLIRYLIRHRHTTPLEMVEFKFRVRVPMDCWRQWIRHRTACLAGDTVISFDLPGRKKLRHYPLTMAEIYNRFQPTENTTRPDKQRNRYFKRDRVRSMQLRSYDEDTGDIYYTSIIDIWQSGVKPIIRIEFPNDKVLRASADHMCLTDDGWLKLKDAIDARAMFLSSDRSKVDEAEWFLPVIDEEREQWVPVIGYEDYYEVSSMGRVRGILSPGGPGGGTKVRSTPRIKTQTVDHRGYFVVSLSKQSGTMVHSVHHLVLEAFVGRRPEGQEARHGNHNRQDNRVDNLSWGSVRDNTGDRMLSGCTQKLIPTFVNPVSWRWDGEEMTYDMSVSGPHHNFYAGGVIVHNSVNEYSTRYSVAIDEKQKTAIGDWRCQADANKQGSGEYLDESEPTDYAKSWADSEDARARAAGIQPRTIGEYLSEQEARFHEAAKELYNERIYCGVAREQARKDLPLSNYTEAYWKMDLHNLFHFLRLRMDDHAQHEIRQYALAMGFEIVAKVVPVAWQAFLDYRHEAVTLTGPETRVIHNIMEVAGGYTSDGNTFPLSRTLFDTIRLFLDRTIDGGLFAGFSKREVREFEGKLRALNILAPIDKI